MFILNYLRLAFIFLSIFQYLGFENFWRSPFIFLLITIILFQMNWFYIKSDLYKSINLFVIGILLTVNIRILPIIPYLLIGLFTLDVFTHFSFSKAKIISGLFYLFFLSSSLLKYDFNESLIVSYVLCISISLSSLCLAVFSNQLTELKAEQFQDIQEKEELEDTSNDLKTQLVSVKEVYTLQERNRIAREIHDSVGHVLSAVIIQLEAISKLTEQTSPQASEMSTNLRQFTKSGLTDVRSVVHKLKPDNYEKYAFTESLNNLISEFETHSKINVSFNKNETRWLFTEKQQELLYRVVQEFLGNSAKHSGATEIRLQLHYTDEFVILTMNDNGRGVEEISPGFGLKGIEERVQLLGGKVNFKSKANNGFKTRIVLYRRKDRMINE